MRWLQRVIAIAVLSMSTVAAGVGASYGQDKQDKTVRIGYQSPNARLAATVGAIAKACAPVKIDCASAPKWP